MLKAIRPLVLVAGVATTALSPALGDSRQPVPPVPAATRVDKALARAQRVIGLWEHYKNDAYTPPTDAQLETYLETLPRMVDKAYGIKMIAVPTAKQDFLKAMPKLGLSDATVSHMRKSSWLNWPWAWPVQLTNRQPACLFHFNPGVAIHMRGLPQNTLMAIAGGHEMAGHCAGAQSRKYSHKRLSPSHRSLMEGEADALGAYLYGRVFGDMKGLLHYTIGRMGNITPANGGWNDGVLRVVEHFHTHGITPLELTEDSLREALDEASRIAALHAVPDVDATERFAHGMRGRVSSSCRLRMEPYRDSQSACPSR